MTRNPKLDTFYRKTFQINNSDKLKKFNLSGKI